MEKNCDNCINRCNSLCGECKFYDGIECHQPADCCKDCIDLENWELDN